MKTEEVVFLAFMGILCFCSCIYTSFCKNKPDQENLETNERQDQVIKTYQIAKVIISATAFESSQLTLLQTRLHFVIKRKIYDSLNSDLSIQNCCVRRRLGLRVRVRARVRVMV